MHAQWNAFQSKLPRLAKQYSAAYAAIYHVVAKWARKAKHAIPCWSLMLRMTCVGSLAFYVDKKREALLPPVLERLDAAELLHLVLLGPLQDVLHRADREVGAHERAPSRRGDVVVVVPDCRGGVRLSCRPRALVVGKVLELRARVGREGHLRIVQRVAEHALRRVRGGVRQRGRRGGARRD